MDANKSSNLETTHHRRQPTTVASTSSTQEDFKGTHDQDLFINSSDHEEVKASLLAAGEGGDRKAERSTSLPTTAPAAQPAEASGGIIKMVVMDEESVREKLKKHRVEMSGRVWIPEIWGQEDLLKNWIDCTVFDSSLDKTSIMSAREALIQHGTSTPPRVTYVTN